MSPLSLTNQKMNMARQLPLLLIVSLMFYIAPAQANDNPVKKGKQQVASVQAPSFSELAPGAGGNPFPNSTAETFGNPAFGDIDGDGDLDMFSGNELGTVLFFENTGDATTPNFVAQTGVNNPMDGEDAGDKSSVSLVDIDNDGDLDMFIGDELGAFLFYENTGDANTPAFTAVVGASNPLDGVDVGNRSQLTFVDLDNDGDYDGVGGEFAGTINYFENTGNASAATFVDRTGVSSPFDAITGTSTNSSVGLGDIDNDLDYDLVLGDKDGSLRYFENTGSVSVPAFTEVTGVSNPLDGFNVGANKESTPAVVDLNNGNGVDVIVGNTDGDFYYYVNADPLPVELSAFNVVKNHDKIIITWTTASETNNAGFEVQHKPGGDARSAGQTSWKVLTFEKGAGTSATRTRYRHSFTDLMPGTHRFRLKQIDFNGDFDYSPVVEVVLATEGAQNMSALYPNPFNPAAQFYLTLSTPQRVNIDVYNALGQKVASLFDGVLAANELHQFNFRAEELPGGLYLINATGENFSTTQRAMLVK